MKSLIRPVQSIQSQRGVALITVLLIVAFAATLAVAMNSRSFLMLNKQIGFTTHQQLQWNGLAAEQLAIVAIKKSTEQDDGKFNLSQPWALELPPLPVQGGMNTIEAKIRDLSSCLNLNNLIAKSESNGDSNARSERGPWLKALQRLIEQQDVQLDASAEDLANRVYDWIDSDSIVNYPGGAEEDTYVGRPHPYLTPNSPMASISELRLIEGFNAPLLKALKDKICVIPEAQATTINVNTINAEHSDLLAAFIDGLADDQASAVLSGRDDKGFSDVADFWARPELAGITVADSFKSQFGTTSQYFELSMVSKNPDTKNQFFLTSILKYDKSQGVTVIARKFGGKL